MSCRASGYFDAEPSMRHSATPHLITVVNGQIESNEALFRIFIPLSIGEISDSFLVKINEQKTNLI